MRHFVFVQLSSSGSRWWFSCSFDWSLLIVLHDGISRGCRLLSFLFNHGGSSNHFDLFHGLLLSQRHHVVHSSRVSSRKFHPERAIFPLEIDATSRLQWCLVANQAPCGENSTIVPPSFMEDTAATRPSTSVTWHVIPMMSCDMYGTSFAPLLLQEFTAGRLELDFALHLSHLVSIRVIQRTRTVCCTQNQP